MYTRTHTHCAHAPQCPHTLTHTHTYSRVPSLAPPRRTRGGRAGPGRAAPSGPGRAGAGTHRPDAVGETGRRRLRLGLAEEAVHGGGAPASLLAPAAAAALPADPEPHGRPGTPRPAPPRGGRAAGSRKRSSESQLFAAPRRAGGGRFSPSTHPP